MAGAVRAPVRDRKCWDVASPLPVSASLCPAHFPQPERGKAVVRCGEGLTCHRMNASLPQSSSLRPTSLSIHTMLNQRHCHFCRSEVMGGAGSPPCSWYNCTLPPESLPLGPSSVSWNHLPNQLCALRFVSGSASGLIHSGFPICRMASMPRSNARKPIEQRAHSKCKLLSAVTALQSSALLLETR